jgi:hypothetical protein
LTLATLPRVRFVASVPVLALALAACGGDKTEPSVPDAFEKTAGDQVTAGVATATPSAPTLKVNDQNGRAMRGIVVNFAVTGGGSLGAIVDTTDASGVATAQRWTLGSAMGPQTVVASSPSLAGTTATFTATATAGTPSRLVFVTQPPPTGRAGEAFQGPTLELQDAFGNRTASTATVSIGMATANGPATLTGTTSVAAVDGRATFGPLTTTTAGVLTMLANTTTIAATQSSTMTVAPGAPAVFTRVSPDAQLGAAGTAAFLPPTVRVTDTFGNGVPGTPVTFSIVSGSGTAVGANATTGANGIANLTRWDLGPAAGPNAVRATTGTGTADFAATAVDALPFHIELRYVNTPTRRQQQAFEAAWLRWRSVITGDIQDGIISSPIDLSFCNQKASVSGQVDDLIIYVTLEFIDGPNKVLGSAGPCLTRGATGLPAVGGMTFDTADLEALDNAGQLDEVVLHEMGHVLGIGTRWTSSNLLVGGGSDTSSFNGPAAKAAWQALGGAAGTRVPVENCVGITQPCGAGTRDGHWRDRTFGSELMTGYLNGGIRNPLSAMTIASLQDIGYQVNATLADAYVLPAGASTGGVRGSVMSVGPSRPLIEGPSPRPRAIDMLPVGTQR